jgi:hypothetical protein
MFWAEERREEVGGDAGLVRLHRWEWQRRSLRHGGQRCLKVAGDGAVAKLEHEEIPVYRLDTHHALAKGCELGVEWDAILCCIGQKSTVVRSNRLWINGRYNVLLLLLRGCRTASPRRYRVGSHGTANRHCVRRDFTDHHS